MSLDPKLKPDDVYPIAIRAEMDAAEIYLGLHGRVKNEVLKQKLDFLAKEEGRHKAILERLFQDHFPDRKLVVPAEAGRPKKAVAVEEATAVLDLFKLAMGKEKEAEEYYRDARAKMDDPRTRKFLEYLSRVERSHYFMLKSEIALLEKFPDYYNAESDDPTALFHLGP
jgi:rubrerythrin